jgi:hypothetical protein
VAQAGCGRVGWLEVSAFEFKLRPSTPGQERALRALDGLDGFSSGLEPDTYFHVNVEAVSFDDAQLRLRDTLAELEDPVTLTVPVLVQQRSEPEDR